MKISQRTIEARKNQALARARLMAACNVRTGTGALCEAITEYKTFRQSFPTLAQAVTCAQWLLEYRACPVWAPIRAFEARKGLSESELAQLCLFQRNR